MKVIHLYILLWEYLDTIYYRMLSEANELVSLNIQPLFLYLSLSLSSSLSPLSIFANFQMWALWESLFATLRIALHLIRLALDCEWERFISMVRQHHQHHHLQNCVPSLYPPYNLFNLRYSSPLLHITCNAHS